MNGSNGMANWSMQGMLTLEQHNHQKALQGRSQRKPAGVLCQCGTEMVYHEPHPAYGISYGDPNCMCPGESPNVACPACGKTGRKR